MATRLGYSDRERYAFLHDELGYQEIREPRNWKDDDKELVRNSETIYGGIFGKMSAEMEFTGNGRDFILQVYSAYGVNSNLRLLKEAQDPDTDEWYRVWDGEVDLTTLVQKDSIVTAKFNADSLTTIIKSRLSEKYEIERTTDLYGNELEQMPLETLELLGRKILLETLLKVPERSRDDNLMHLNHRTNSYRHLYIPLPVVVDYESDELVTTPFEGEEWTEADTGTTGLLFYLPNDRQKELNISISFSTKIRVLDINNVDNAWFRIELIRYTNGANYDIAERWTLYDDPNVRTIANREIQESGSHKIILDPDESLGLVAYAGGNNWGTLFENGDIYISLDELNASISISEDSFVDASQSNVAMPYEVMKRIMTIITGREDTFFSTALGRTDLGFPEDGEAALCGLSHGHWKRGFIKGDDLYKPFTTSIKDFMQSYGAVWGLAMGVEKIGFQERLIIENRDYFYNRNVTLRLGYTDDNGKFIYEQVNNVERTVDAEKIYSEVTVGTDKFEPYEEIQGLDEFNTQSTFSTVINKIQNTFTLLSKYRRDATGGEIARRLSKETKPTEDTQYDEKIFMEDMKRSATDVYQQRKWQDDFSAEPTGIFDPDSATNLRLSQVRMILRNGWELATSLIKYPKDFIRFTSTEGNGSLETRLTGEDVYRKENEDIPNSDLERAVHEPELVAFEYKVDNRLMAEIEGKSVILGRQIENKYGLVEFMNEKGQIERGHIQSLKPNGPGEWILTKYYTLN